MKRICKDKREFFRTALESIRGTNSCYNEDYPSFDSIPECEWNDVLGTYLQEVLYVNISSKNIDVDFENVGHGGEYTHGGLDGLMSLETGELFYCFDCGGDWECPVNAVIYVDDGKVKFHVPEKGNNFNARTKCAYGNETDNAVEAVDRHLENRIDREAELEDIRRILLPGVKNGRPGRGVPAARFSSGEWNLEKLDDKDGFVYSVVCEKTGREICRIPRQLGGIKRTAANARLIQNAPKIYRLLEAIAGNGMLKSYQYTRGKSYHDRALELLSKISGEQ